MKRFLCAAVIAVIAIFTHQFSFGQTNQTFTGGSTTPAITLSSGTCPYTWTNNNTAIGLKATGTGTSIPSFKAANSGSTPIVATIKARMASNGYAYITNSKNTVSVINTADNTVVNTITVGNGPNYILINPDGTRMYVAATGSGLSSNISVIDMASEKVIYTIDAVTDPIHGMVLSPDGSKLYVGSLGNSTATNGSISVISTSSFALLYRINFGDEIAGIALSNDGSVLYASELVGNKVAVINTATNSVTTQIQVGTSPYQMKLTPDGSRLYVGNLNSNNVSVISTATNSVIKTIGVESGPYGIDIDPDGTMVYVANSGSDDVSVIDAATNTVIKNVGVGHTPRGISLSPDGSMIYVINAISNTVSIISTADYTVSNTLTLAAGSYPVSLGYFFSPGVGCNRVPISFTITVNPNAPTITAGKVSGNIYACLGDASSGANVQQFTVSGSSLTGDINISAPAGFELSTSATGSFAASLSLAQNNSNVNATTLYVRSSASATAGTPSGNVTLTSPGATTITVPVLGDVFATPTIDPVISQTLISGNQTTATYFTGTASNFNWTNNNTSISLAASGSGNIASFTAVNNTSNPVTATITVTPLTSHGAAEGDITCFGKPVTFTITVKPVPVPAITTNGSPSALGTVYGTPSSATTFTVTGTALTSGILVTPPAGFEVSTDNTSFAPTLTIGTVGDIPTTTVYVRLAATTPVNQYAGNIELTSGSLNTVDVAMPNSTVSPATLTITADNKKRLYGTYNPVLTASYAGFVNNEGAGILLSQPQLSTIATVTSPVGEYPIVITNAKAQNYNIDIIDGILTVEPPFIVIPNTFTPNGDGINDVWNIQYIENYPDSRVSVYNRSGQLLYFSVGYAIPWDGKYKGTNLPAGTYYYIIDTKSKQQVYSGYVAVVR